jgi:hypothetical protein
MSHISRCTTKLKITESSYELLKTCAVELGAEVVTTSKNSFYVRYKGLYINVTEDKEHNLTFTGDNVARHSAWHEFTDKLPMKFKEKATMIAMRKCGLTHVTVKQKGKQLVIAGC